MPTKKINIECVCQPVKLDDGYTVCAHCIPRNPFYVRWINRYGGWDYWMFSKRQTFEREIKNLQTFNPYISDYSIVDGTTVVIDKTVESKLTIGAEGLTATEWNLLSFIADSVLVQWYNEDSRSWIEIIVEKTKLEMQTDNALHGMEFTIQLPTPQLAL